jgi:chromosome segregation ATPase
METSEISSSQKKENTQKMHSPMHNDSWLKRNGGFILAFAVIVILGSWVFLAVYQHDKKKEYNNLESQYHDLSGQLLTRDSLITEWISLFDQVEKDLQTIKEKENLLSSLQSEDMELTQNKREAVLRDIQMLNTLLEENKKKIARLNSDLKSSGIKIAGLEQKINDLSLALEERNQSVDSLKGYLVEKDFELSQLNTHLTNMEVNLAEKQTTIEHKRLN